LSQWQAVQLGSAVSRRDASCCDAGPPTHQTRNEDRKEKEELMTVLPPRRFSLVFAIAVTLLVSTARGHVQLLDPNGGEELQVASMFTIRWKILIAHDLQNWDLWYSIEGSDGPWTPIATDLPPGDDSAGSVHTYDWQVPDDPSDSAWVRVRMDNGSTDYYDVSDNPFSIVAQPCPADFDDDGDVDTADLLFLLGAWGTPDGDVDGDGDTDTADLLALLGAWGECP
jgi:hypothetical protein